MKRKLLTIILTAAVIAEALAILTLPAFAWSWKDNGKFEVAEHLASVVDNGSITLDALLDDAYIGGTKIESYPDESPYRRNKYDSVWADANGNFVAYIAADTNGLYVYAEIEDSTIFPSTNSNGNDGDCFQIYLDWCPEGVVHPSSEELYSMYQSGSAWNAEAYKKTYAKNQYLGWLSGDYYGVYGGWGGFSSVNAMGPNKNEKVIYKTRFTNDGWACEWFIPWRDQTQKNAVANGEQFHIGIGFQSSDDSDINNTVTAGKEENVGITFDQRNEIGLSYWADYSMLSDLKLCKHDWKYSRGVEKTCTTDGYKLYICGKCGNERVEDIPASHGEEIEYICSVAGMKASVCAECEAVISESEATAEGESHFYEKLSGWEATCTENGYEGTKCRYCEACDERITTAKGHKCLYSNKLEKFVCQVCLGEMDLGDINGDGAVTNSDVLAIFRYIYNPELYPTAANVADVNCDGAVTNSDVLAIFRNIYNPELYPLVKEKEEFQINGVPISKYVIIYSNNDTAAKKCASNLRNAIRAVCGVTLPMYTSNVSYRGDYEILVGYSSRLSDAASDLAEEVESLASGEYLAYRKGSFLYLGGQKGDILAVTLAANKLINEIKNSEYGFADVNITSAAKMTSGSKYSIITYNDGGNSVTNTTQILAILNEYDPDIIGFQETQEKHLSTYSKGLGNKYNYVYFDNDGTTFNSQPIYYKKDKFTLIESGIKWLSDTPDVRSKIAESDYTRSFTYAVLRDRSTGKDIVVVNTHIDYVAAANVKQVELLLKYTKQFKNLPIFYTADYNMQNYSDGYNTMRGADFIDCGTALGKNVAGHIDFCFVDLDLSIPVGYEYISNHQYSETASDHYPVYAEILVHFE